MKTIISLILLMSATAQAEVYKCNGTEPFWTLNYNSNTTKIVVWDHSVPQDDEAPTFEALSDTASPNYVSKRLVKATDGVSFWISQQAEGTTCSDGMSDFDYEYEILLDYKGAALVGCCNPIPGSGNK